MKNSFLVAVLFIAAACGSHGHQKTTKKYSLQPRAKVPIVFAAKHEAQISFTTVMSSEQRARCQNECIRLISLDSSGNGEAVRSAKSASLTIQPAQGKVKATLENVESFPIQVNVTWQH